ncbi:hypothetical protein BC833DRAFT_583602 [Globomyces pollinis-pini]|nr:hypothetical protein BC833DRAFT_583602 [Globomyces pollinis-pini]
MDENQAYISYYLSKKWYHHVLSFCELKLKKLLGEPILTLWKAVALVHTGNPTLAIQELSVLEDKRDFVHIWHLAMLFAHQNCKFIDHEAIQAIQAKYTIASTNANPSDKAFTIAGVFCWHVGNQPEAIKFFKQALNKNPNNISALSGLGWIELLGDGYDKTTWFEKALEKSMRDIEGMFGKMLILKRQRKYTASLDVCNRIIAYYPTFIPAYVEKMYTQLENGLWNELLDSCHSLIAMSPDNLDGLKMLVWHEICWEGSYSAASNHLETLFKAIDRLEPGNTELLYEITQTFGRLCNRNDMILSQCQLIMNKAIKMKPNNANYLTELGYIYFLKGDLDNSKAMYQNASSLDPQNLDALEGTVRWLIFSSQLQMASEQLEMYNEIQRNFGESVSISYLNSALALRKSNTNQWLLYLKECAQLQLKNTKDISISPTFYHICNPETLLSIVRDYMDHIGFINVELNVDHNELQQLVRDLLQLLLKIVPGSTEALYYSAKTNLTLGNPILAEKQLEECIAKNKSNFKAFILLAEINCENQNFKGGLSALEMALSFDFHIRHECNFFLLKTRCFIGLKEYDNALTVLNSSFNLPNVKEAIKAIDFHKEWNKSPTVAQVGQMYLFRMEAEAGLNMDIEKIMEEALRLFKGTPNENIFIITKGKESLKRNDIQGALDILGSIKPDEMNYLEARSLMADIYLNHKKDRKGFAECFREVVERRPTVESCILLGDAYIKITEPEEAIKVYQSAYNAYPTYTVFVSKIGKTYTMMHEYSKAIAYYKTGISANTSEKRNLQYELAYLLQKMKKYEDSNDVVDDALEDVKGQTASELESKLFFIKGMNSVHLGLTDESSTAFMQSKEILSRLLMKESGPEAQKIRSEIADVCYQMALVAENNSKDYDRASAYYNEASQYDSNHIKSLVALGKLQIKQNNLPAAQSQLTNLVQLHPESTEASLILADVLCEKSSFQLALFHYRQILDQYPSNYEVLANYIDLCRRMNTLKDIPKFFEISDKKTLHTKLSAGYHYCKGLYLRFINNLNESLKEFAICRRDGTWGVRALYHLIEIFLNPGEETLGGEALEGAIETSQSTADLNADTDLMGILTADKLIKELPQNPKSLKTQILECHALLSTKQTTEIEKAITIQMEILNTERDYIPAIYGTSVAFMLLKQTPRARNQLKRVSKMEWTREFGDDIEKCWLLLADIYIQGGKYDLATELLRKVTTVNLSCSKAWEYLGFIMEKEQSYKDAADYYLKCWDLYRQQNPSIGYKLAFNYLKAKRFTDAIDICHLVLNHVPDYPKIKSEILDKSRASIRFP